MESLPSQTPHIKEEMDILKAIMQVARALCRVTQVLPQPESASCPHR